MDYFCKLKKKILYRSNYRGCKETDLIIGNFTKKYIKDFSIEELQELNEILNENDNLLFKWITQKIDLPAKYANSDIMKKLIIFQQHKFNAQ